MAPTMDQTNFTPNVSETQERAQAQTEVPARGGRGRGRASRTRARRTIGVTSGRGGAQTMSSCYETAISIMNKSTAGWVAEAKQPTKLEDELLFNRKIIDELSFA